jgi:cytidine deaminase
MDCQVEGMLIGAAVEAWGRAYAPYSSFRVGAALLAGDGAVFSGCNVENASYGLTVCAERNAVARAVAEGGTRFKALAIVADSDPPAMPCGACRQVLAEFADDLEIVLANPHGQPVARATLKDLLPQRFAFPRRESQNPEP